MKVLLSLSFCSLVATSACENSKPAPEHAQAPEPDNIPDAAMPDAGPPSAGLIYPATVFLGRQTDLALTFHDTMIDATSTVDFGAGITANAPVVVSATTLYVHVQIADNAATGPRSVTAQVGGQSIQFTNGLTVSPAVTLTSPAGSSGTMAQGSYATLDAVDLDLENQFVCASTGGIFSSPYVYFQGDNSVWTNFLTECAPDHVTAAVLWAPLAPATPNVNVINGAGSTSVFESFIGGPIQVAPRTPVMLTPGVVLPNENIDKPYATQLYRMKATGPAIATVAMYVKNPNDDDSSFWPSMMVFGESGTFDDWLASPWPNIVVNNIIKGTQVRYPVTAIRNTDAYFIATDGYMRGGDPSLYGYSVTPTVIPIPAGQQVTELEPNDKTPSQTLTPTKPLLVSGTFSGPSDVDQFNVSLISGQTLQVVLDSDIDCDWNMNNEVQAERGRVRLGNFSYVAPSTGTFFLSLMPAATNSSTLTGPFEYVIYLEIQ